MISQGFLGAKAPLQSVFAKDTAFLSAKTQKLQKAQLFAIVARSFMEETCFCFWKAKETALLKKRAKYKGEAFWHLNRPILCKRYVPKLGKSAKPNSRDNMPVLALELGTLFPDLAWGFW